MKRMEIILNQSIEEDFSEACRLQNVGTHFTKIPAVQGTGFSVPKMGNGVWPQLNACFVIYCSDAECKKIAAIVNLLRKTYPKEGIACFVAPEDFNAV